MTDLREIRDNVAQLARDQADFHGSMFAELTRIHVAQTDLAGTLRAFIERVDDRLEDHSQRMEEQAREAGKLLAVVRVLEGIEARRDERARMVKIGAKLTGAVLGLAATTIGIAQAIAQGGH